MRVVSCAETCRSTVPGGRVAPLSAPWLRATAAADGHLEGADLVVGGDPMRGPGEDPVRVGRGADVELDPGPEPVDVCDEQRVVGLLAGRGQEGRCPGGLAGRPRVASRREPTRGSRVRVDGELGGAFVGVRRGPVGTPSLGAEADLVEQGADLLVGPLGRCRPVPRGTVGVLEPGQDVGERTVHVAPLVPRGGLVDRGPDERVPNGHGVAADHQQS